MSQKNDMKERLKAQKLKDTKKIEIVLDDMEMKRNEQRDKAREKELKKMIKDKPVAEITGKSKKFIEQKDKKENLVREIFLSILEDEKTKKYTDDLEMLNYYVDKEFPLKGLEGEDREAKQEERKIGVVEWSESQNIDKPFYILSFFVDKKGFPDDIKAFFRKLLDLDSDLRDDFIVSYLNQSLGFNVYYQSWLLKPEIRKKFVEMERTVVNQKENIKTKIKNIIIERAKNYAREKGKLVDEDENKYYKILENIISYEYIKQKNKLKESYLVDKTGLEKNKPSSDEKDEVKKEEYQKAKKKLENNYKKKYQELEEKLNNQDLKDQRKKEKKELNKKFIGDINKISRELGIKSYRNIDDLAEKIQNKERDLLRIIGIARYQEINNLSKKSLEKKLGLKDEEDIDEKLFFLYKILLMKIESKNKEVGGDRDVNEILNQISKYGISVNPKYLENPEKHKDILSLILEREKSQRNLKLTQKLIDIPENERKKEEMIRRQKDEDKKYRVTQKMLDDNQEIDKDELRYVAGREYVDIDEEDVENLLDNDYNWLYYKAVERRELLKKLDADINDYPELNNEQLKNKIAGTKKIKKKVINNMIEKTVCKKLNYKLYGKYDVKGIYISKMNKKSLKMYVEEKHIELKYNDSLRKFYKANALFEDIICRNGSSQNGDIFKYNQLELIVGYMITIKPSGITNSVLKFGNEYLVIQNEDLYNWKKKISSQNKLLKSQQIEKTLNRQIDQEALNIASSFLSGELSNIAGLKDYSSREEPYIKIAIKSVLDSQDEDYLNSADRETIGNFFDKVAKTLVYLKYKEANIFHKKIANEYYIPELLLKLPESEKLPELYNIGINEEQKQLIMSYLNNQIKRTVRNMASVYDPTIRYENIFIEQPAIYYDKKFCENSDDIMGVSKENTVLYRDESNGKIYCYNIDQLTAQFDSGNFKNKYTGEKFSNDFIRRYTVQYYDPEENETMTFSHKKLYDRFKKGNNKIPGKDKEFDKNFIDRILFNKDYKESIYFRGKFFEKQDLMVSMCVNSSEMLNRPIENIVFYDDEKGDKYCFDIQEISKQINNDGDKINKYTGRKFSKDFINKIKSYDIELKDGIRNQKYKDKYGDIINLEEESGVVQEELPIEKFVEPIFEEKEGKREPFIILNERDLLIKNLCKIVGKNINALKKENQALFAFNSSENNDEENNKEENNNEDNEEDNEEDNSEENSQENSQENHMNEESDKDMEEVKEKSDNNLCSSCDKKISDFMLKSVGYDDKVHNYVFCSSECMSNFNFPKLIK